MTMDQAIVASNADAEQTLVKVKHQAANATRFWDSASWTLEEKAKTLEPAKQVCNLLLSERSPTSRRERIRRGWRTGPRASKASGRAAVTSGKLDFDMLQKRMKAELNLATEHEQQSAANKINGHKYITLLSDFVEFVGEFSGVVEIMRGVDQGYGGAGYEALSALLTVVLNTKRHDDIVNEAFLDLKNEYSRMMLVSELYPTPAMRAYITTAYTLGIEFLREAQDHYSRPIWRRILYSVVNPPFLLQRRVKEISNAMTQIHKERDALLSKRVYDIHTQLGQVDAKVDGVSHDVHSVRNEIDVLHSNQVEERLSVLVNDLSKFQIQQNQSVSDYSRALDASLSYPLARTRFTMDELVARTAYKSWVDSPRSCLMILNGLTTTDQTSFCWLSPAAMKLAGTLRSNVPFDNVHRAAVVEAYCQTRDLTSETIQQSAVLVTLIAQLLQAIPNSTALLRDVHQFELFRARLRTACDSNVDELFEILNELIQKFEEVYVIVDRIDRVSGDIMRAFMKKVIAPGKKGMTRVRILFVAARMNDGILADRISELQQEMDEKSFIPLQIDQC